MNPRVRGSEGVARPIVEAFEALAAPDPPSRAFPPAERRAGSESTRWPAKDRQGLPGAFPVAWPQVCWPVAASSAKPEGPAGGSPVPLAFDPLEDGGPRRLRREGLAGCARRRARGLKGVSLPVEGRARASRPAQGGHDPLTARIPLAKAARRE